MLKPAFRNASSQDKSQILQLLYDRQEESNQQYGGTKNIVLNQGSKIFDEIITSQHSSIIVGESNSRIICLLTLHLLPQIRSGGCFAFIEDVLVAPAFRNQGIGRQLMQYTIGLCRQNPKVKKVKLGTREAEPKLHNFYQSLGFKFTERQYKLTLT